MDRNGAGCNREPGSGLTVTGFDHYTDVAQELRREEAAGADNDRFVAKGK